VWLAARTRDELETAAGEIRNAGAKAHAVVCDVTKPKELRAAIADMPSLDVFVNNAGTNIPEPFVEVSDDHLDTLLNLNVRAAFIAAQAAARKMIECKSRGAIINMSSQMGHVGAVNRSVYCLTKHALEGLTKAMALELAPHGIRVVSVAPTFIETPMYQRMKQAKPELARWVEDRIPLGKTGKPEDVAAAVVFAASPAAALVTGTSLLIDGGWTAQ
jgi:NAD(P)-dependent dehydrogenase (short-subunit alcohol dehydrogenase family)